MMEKFLRPDQYLPHKAPMCLIDKLLEIDEEHALLEVNIAPQSGCGQLLDAKGHLPWFYAIELIAQGIGVWSGYWDLKLNKEIKVGMLLGAREIKTQSDFFSAGSILQIRVDKLLQDEGLASFNGHILIAGQEIATGRVNVIRVDDALSAQIFSEK